MNESSMLPMEVTTAGRSSVGANGTVQLMLVDCGAVIPASRSDQRPIRIVELNDTRRACLHYGIGLADGQAADAGIARRRPLVNERITIHVARIERRGRVARIVERERVLDRVDGDVVAHQVGNVGRQRGRSGGQGDEASRSSRRAE